MRSLLLALALLTGCATLPAKEIPRAPERTAPFEQRARYLLDYATDGELWREGQPIELQGGDRIYRAEDLLPAVDEGSPTAIALREHAASRREAELFDTFLTTPMLVSFFVSLTAVGLALPAVLVLRGGDFGATLTDPWLLVPSGWLLGSTLGFVVGAWLEEEPRRVAADTRHKAYVTYPAALEARLGLHVNDEGEIVDVAEQGTAPRPARPGAHRRVRAGDLGGALDDAAPPLLDEPPPPLPPADPLDE